MDIVETAAGIARVALAGKLDKGGRPIVLHCARVAAALADQGEAPAVVAAGWLHDTVEDGAKGWQGAVRSLSPPSVWGPVELLSRNVPTPGEANVPTPGEYYARIRADRTAMMVKLADITDNMDPDRRAGLAPTEAARLGAKYQRALEQLVAVPLGDAMVRVRWRPDVELQLVLVAEGHDQVAFSRGDWHLIGDALHAHRALAA